MLRSGGRGHCGGGEGTVVAHADSVLFTTDSHANSPGLCKWSRVACCNVESKNDTLGRAVVGMTGYTAYMQQ